MRSRKTSVAAATLRAHMADHSGGGKQLQSQEGVVDRVIDRSL